VRGAYPRALESVHHTDWPTADMAVVDENLVEHMALARRIASLGLSARGNANLKVRQPLSQVLVHVGRKIELLPELVEIVEDELNVKGLGFVEEEGKLVSYRILLTTSCIPIWPRFPARVLPCLPNP
jgi:isoleucyl-tRNA synthetase